MTKHNTACYFKKKESKNYLFLYDLPVQVKANDKILDSRLLKIFLAASYIFGSWIVFFFLAFTFLFPHTYATFWLGL